MNRPLNLHLTLTCNEDTAMGYYRLKAGGYTAGHGVTSQFFTSSDPKNNVVQCDEDLAALHPEKFDEFKGEPPDSAKIKVPLPEVAPPGPPSARGIALAGNMGPMSAEERRSRAEELRKQAEALEEEAANEEKGEDTSEAASEHRKTLFAKSDSAEAFEEEGQEKAKRLQQASVVGKKKEIAAQRRAEAATAKEEGREVEEDDVEVVGTDETGEETDADAGEGGTKTRTKTKRGRK